MSGHQDLVGQRLGRFTIDEVLGAGGQACVFRATTDNHEKDGTVALKVVRGDPDADDVKRLRAEAEALELLVDGSVPIAPRLLDLGSAGNLHWLAMDRMNGGRIDRYCDDHRLDVFARVRLFRRVCLAVQAAHDRGILHRDLKPEHILVHEAAGDDAEPQPCLIDFGLAAGTHRKLVTTLHTGVARLGTQGYASPEQWSNGRASIQSDVYSLGATLHELLVGCLPTPQGSTDGTGEPQRADEHLPPPATTFRNLVAQAPQRAAVIATTRKTTPAGLQRALAGPLGRLLGCALLPEPVQRYRHASEFADELQRFLEFKPLLRTPSSRRLALRLFLRRHRTALLAQGLLLAVLIGSFAWLIQRSVYAEESAAADRRQLQAMTERQAAVVERLLAAGRLATELRQWDRALDYYDQAAAAGPVHPIGIGMLRIEALEAKREVRQARTLLNQLLAHGSAGPWLPRLLVLDADLGVDRFTDPDAGLESARRALVLQQLPGFVPLREADHHYAKALLAGRPRDALARLRRANLADAGHSRVNQALGSALLLLGEIDEVRTFARTSLALNPDDEESQLLSVVMLALAGEPTDHHVAAIQRQFGAGAGEVAEETAQVMECATLADQQLRRAMSPGGFDLAGQALTLTTVFGRFNRLRAAVHEREQEHSHRGQTSSLMRVPPAVARAYRPLVGTLQQGFNMGKIRTALAGLEVGQIDGFLLFMDAVARTWGNDPLGAAQRVDEALRSPSFLITRKTLLLSGTLMAMYGKLDPSAPLTENQRDALGLRVLPWLEELALNTALSASELRAVFGAARAQGASRLTVPVAHRWFVAAPTDPLARLARIEALVLEGAPDRALELWHELERDPEVLPKRRLERAVLDDTRAWIRRFAGK